MTLSPACLPAVSEALCSTSKNLFRSKFRTRLRLAKRQFRRNRQGVEEVLSSGPEMLKSVDVHFPAF